MIVRRFIQGFAIAALVAILIVSVLYARESLSLHSYKIFLLFASLLWFGCIIFSKFIQK